MHYDAGMGVELLTERHKDQIAGVLSCYDRILIQGTVPGWCYARGMTDYFYKHQLRIFDYPKWAEPLRQQLRQNLERIAAENALPIEFVRSRKSFRKEDRVKQILEKRGEHREWCAFCRPWSRAAATSRGTTSQATKPISSRTMASTCSSAARAAGAPKPTCHHRRRQGRTISVLDGHFRWPVLN